MTWDVRLGETPVRTLSGLARALGTSRARAAKALLADPALAQAAPADLVREAKAADGGGDKPPPIDTGSFVSWSGGKGRVDLVVRKGKVPGVDSDVEATEESPAARVVVWKDGKPTREKVAASTHTLKRIAPLDGDAESKSTPAATLVAMVTRHNERVDSLGLPEYRHVMGAAARESYQRGVKAHPADRTTLTREEWGLGRVAHFLKVANGEIAMPSRAGHDVDLLAKGHPLCPVDEDVVTLDRGEVDATLADIRSFLSGT